jgi:P pilus assembly chaperone PapD
VKKLVPWLLAGVFSSSVFADMRIDRAIVYFDADEAPRQDVEVSTLSAENLYLQVDVEEVINPGTEKEERRQVKDLEDMGFIASPVKSIVPPNGKRRIRLLNLKGPQDSEKIYRVTFKPVAKEFKADQSMLKLLVAYQSLVIVRPAAGKADVQAQREGQRLMISNAGKSNVYLENGQACRPGGEDCRQVGGRRLYAGNLHSIDVSDGRSEVSYTLNDGKNPVRRTF